MKKTKILMVCLGNICRSPLAEGILKSKLNNQHFEIDSAGTSGYHEGNPPDNRSIEVGLKNGIDIRQQKSRPFRISDFQEFDYIFVMDKSNYQNVVNLAQNKEEKQKVSLILNTLDKGNDEEVPDPYYGGTSGFDKVYTMLDEACDIIAERLQK